MPLGEVNSFELYTIREEEYDSSTEINHSEHSEMQYDTPCWQKFRTWIRRTISMFSKPLFYVVYVCSLLAVITFTFKTLGNPPITVRNNKKGINLTKINFSQSTLCNDTTLVLDEYVDTDINMTGIINQSIKTWMVLSNQSKYNTSRTTNCVHTIAIDINLEANHTTLKPYNSTNNTILPQFDSVLIQSNHTNSESDATTSNLNTSLSGLNDTYFAILLDIIFKHKVYPPVLERPDHLIKLNGTNLNI